MQRTDIQGGPSFQSEQISVLHNGTELVYIGQGSGVTYAALSQYKGSICYIRKQS